MVVYPFDAQPGILEVLVVLRPAGEQQIAWFIKSYCLSLMPL